MAARDRAQAFVEDKGQNGNPREKEALDYIKKHKVMELFDNFTAQLLYSRPCKSNKFTLNFLFIFLSRMVIEISSDLSQLMKKQLKYILYCPSYMLC